VTILRLGSRGSQLALFQARLVAERIKAAGGPECEVVVIKTSGDQLQERPLSEIGGKRLFVKELEDALMNGEVDLAVHSSKDMPAALPDGLEVGAVLEREDPRDALVLGSDPRTGDASPRETTTGTSGTRTVTEVSPRDVAAAIGAGRIGTGSVRRIAQLRAIFPAASFENIRGNLDTRLRKLDAGEYDLLVLAAAGLRRLGFASRISSPLSLDDCVPAPGQGIIAIEIRSDDRETRQAVARVGNADASAALDAERAVVTALGGGCQMPIGAIAVAVGQNLEMRALVASLDGTRVIRYKKVGSRANAGALGREVADELLEQGAAAILSEAAPKDAPHRDPNSLRLT
jgi:hydroxymethylbilane synthase